MKYFVSISLIVIVLLTAFNAIPEVPDTASTSTAYQYYPPNPAVIHNLVNTARSHNSLPALAYSTDLQQAAAYKCADMAKDKYYAHDNPNGLTMLAVTEMYVTIRPGAWVGQNLADGVYSSPAVFKAWMASPEHKANILNVQYTAEGIAACRSDYSPATSDVPANATFIVEDFAQL